MRKSLHPFSTYRARSIRLMIGFILVSTLSAMGQSSSLLSDGVQDFVRRQQLTGKVSLQAGLLVNSFDANYAAIDSLLPEWKGSKGGINIQWLPFSSTLQYNSHHPYGWNDGAMIPARGVQTLMAGGFRLTHGKFSLQIKPEIVLAQNPDFETFPEEHYDFYWSKYYQLLNTIDLPEKFGTGSYRKVFAGQSSLRFTTRGISIGLSTENLWWGPGRYNALVMSNNAPGFLHGTVNTTKPILTNIGSFEGQIIAGRLTSSGITPPDTNRYYNGTKLYQPKTQANRFITAMVVSWQPKWTKGLSVGFTTASYLYRADMSIVDVLPLQAINSASRKAGKKAVLGSLFARYAMPQEKAELYFEYGRNDKSPNLVNIAGDNGYPRAFVAGFRKLFATKRQNQFIELASEFTQLELSTADLIQKGISWYADSYVRQGYTNQGKVLGAGIGPGSNSQLIDISWVKGFNKVGLKFERINHNNDFYYNSFPITNDYTRHWVDVSTTLHADWQVHRFILSGKMAMIRSLNYEYFIFPGRSYFSNGYDVLNFHGNLSFSYRL